RQDGGASDRLVDPAKRVPVHHGSDNSSVRQRLEQGAAFEGARIGCHLPRDERSADRERAGHGDDQQHQGQRSAPFHRALRSAISMLAESSMRSLASVATPATRTATRDSPRASTRTAAIRRVSIPSSSSEPSSPKYSNRKPVTLRSLAGGSIGPASGWMVLNRDDAAFQSRAPRYQRPSDAR